MEDYQDIIYEKRPMAVGQMGVSPADRAAQFAPFAALSGFDGVIWEAGRLTDGEIDMDEGELLAMNQTLCALAQEISDHPCVQLVWFCPDERKAGGAYRAYTGHLKKLDAYARLLIFTDGTKIPIDSLRSIQKTGE